MQEKLKLNIWFTYFLKKLSEKRKHLELNQYTEKLSYTTISFSQKKIKKFDFEGYFHWSERSRSPISLSTKYITSISIQLLYSASICDYRLISADASINNLCKVTITIGFKPNKKVG